uniref:PMEL/NMB N-terminal domain-containing protein n=1 Tax=Ailuropoda melanoleuca TaxID=9646 RepID=A0A7N5KMC1_AILME
MKGTCLFFLLGYLFIGEHVLSATASKRFRDVMTHGTAYSRNKLDHWYSDHNNWNDKLYPTWEKGDPRWKNCWKGGKVLASLTSDSPALVGSNVTFIAKLKFPRCQKEDNDSNIIYDRTCLNNSSVLYDEYVYNWTQWIDDCSWVNCTHNNSYNVFPDGKSFPYHHGWRRRNFIFIFHTLGQYYQIKGGSSLYTELQFTVGML